MSAFGDMNFKSSVYENLDWLVSEDPFEKIQFLHQQIVYLLTGETDMLHEEIDRWRQENGTKMEEVAEELAIIYAYSVESYKYLKGRDE